ncbi:hypothetical protein [Streptomyces afghaniensis]|uniref:hypothetical protein n=1 Tax=Streptomyces afghaniensis TaxID=66865 RepID=UPI0037AF3B45
MTHVTVGSEETRLIVMRGNSASDKSAVAAGLREKSGRGLALVAQDNLRRVVPREHDLPGAANIALIDTVARYALHVNETQLRDWYRPLDLLPGGVETVIGADSSLAATVDRIMHDTGLCRQTRQRGVRSPSPDLRRHTS